MAAELLVQQTPRLSVKGRILAYYEFTKPKIWYLLVFTSMTAAYISSVTNSSELSIGRWLLIGVAIVAGCAGCNALTSYHDRDIDAVMLRTRHRPLPSGRITRTEGLLIGVLLAALSLIMSAMLNLLSLLWMALGIVDNVLVYSLLLKRRTPLNILLGGFSGGLPVLFGWSAATPGPIGTFSLLPVLMAALVFLWIPIHIWFLAVSYRSDYSKAGIPMLPVVVGRELALRIITILSLVFLPFSLAIYLVGDFGLVYAAVALVGGAANLLGSIYVLRNPSETNAWRMFKVSSPYLFMLFVGMIVDVALRG